MQQLKERIQTIVSKYDLLEHPFYKSWSEGTMPSDRLATYSSEYGTFIGLVSELWDACGYPEIAEEEREHRDLWNGFALSLGTSIAEEASIDQVQELNAFMAASCGDRTEAMGAVLAFEFQQPTTVASKLEGLRTHYSALNADEEYFEVHLNDWDEPRILIDEIGKLDAEGQEKALASLERGCALLWDALTGINESAVATA